MILGAELDLAQNLRTAALRADRAALENVGRGMLHTLVTLWPEWQEAPYRAQSAQGYTDRSKRPTSTGPTSKRLDFELTEAALVLGPPVAWVSWRVWRARGRAGGGSRSW